MAIVPIQKKSREETQYPSFGFSNWRRQIDQLMKDFSLTPDLFVEGSMPRWSSYQEFSPSVDVLEKEREYVVTAELAGIPKEKLDLQFFDNVLTMRGEKESTETEKEGSFTRTERSFGSFFRSIPLSMPIEESKIKAHFENGILKVVLPKSSAALAQSKKISIQ
jgi:HSP20 family protein